MATLKPGRDLVFEQGVLERTKGRSFVYLIVNPDGTTWKVRGPKRTTAQRGALQAPWLASARLLPKEPCWQLRHPWPRIEKGKRILQEVHEGARMYIPLTDAPIDDEHIITEWLSPTETNRQRTKTI